MLQGESAAQNPFHVLFHSFPYIAEDLTTVADMGLYSILKENMLT